VGRDAQRGVMVEAPPPPPFEMPQPDFLLEFLIVAFDPPAKLGNIDELTKRDAFWKSRQPIFDRLFRAIGPFDQQKLFGPTVGEPVIPMRDRMRTRAKRGDNFDSLLALPRAGRPTLAAGPPAWAQAAWLAARRLLSQCLARPG
jgi:hypothetical protein